MLGYGLNYVPQRDVRLLTPPSLDMGSLQMPLRRDKVFRVALLQHDWCPCRKRTETRRGDTEMADMLLQGRQMPRWPPEARKGSAQREQLVGPWPQLLAPELGEDTFLLLEASTLALGLARHSPRRPPSLVPPNSGTV